MVRPAVVAAVLAAALCLGAQGQDLEPKRGKRLIADCQTQFGLDMYSLLTEHDTKSNIFFSPMSIGTALAMTYGGASGETARQMADVLHFEGRKPEVMRAHRGLIRYMKRQYKEGLTVKMTNRMYAAHTLRFRSKFSSFMNRMFEAEINRLNFGRAVIAARRINENVKKDTAGNIQELIEAGMLSDLTRLVMVNAIYFKGTWLMKFDQAETREADFHTPTGLKRVQMMKTKKGFPVGSAWSLDARILELPYKGEDVSMLILLPNDPAGIHALDRKMANVSFDELRFATSSDDDVEVQLPRFKMEERINLKLVLTKMGMPDLFDQNRANLRRISGHEQLYVSDAVHKATVEVNEEGTVATAATGMAFSFRMLRPRPKPFIVDRPFIFVIRDVRIGATLFMGRVMNP